MPLEGLSKGTALESPRPVSIPQEGQSLASRGLGIHPEEALGARRDLSVPRGDHFSLQKAFSKGVPILFKSLSKGVPILFKSLFKGFPILFKGLFKGFLSFLKAFLRGSYPFQQPYPDF